MVAVGDGDSEHAIPCSAMAKVAEPCLLTAHTEACKSWKWHLYIHVLGHECLTSAKGPLCFTNLQLNTGD